MANLLRAIFGTSLFLVAAIVSVSSSSAQTAQEAAPKPKPTQPNPKSKPKPKPKPPGEQAAPMVGGVQPTLLGTYGEWGAYTAAPGGKKICFALAKPGKSETVPPNRPRDPAYFFISSRPAEKVKDEVSIIIGYGFKPNSEATIELAGGSYAMYTQGDGAWLKNAAEEPRLVEAMRKGSDVTVKGESARGTATTDVYSLKGLSQALDKIDEECQ
ncbi:MAG TPA: invasion associated locus B family protein [Xanthobacteraceae bacterium]|nr:invasion associated locus B family protein [Xanthobacteraceae bacterium]